MRKEILREKCEKKEQFVCISRTLRLENVNQNQKEKIVKEWENIVYVRTHCMPFTDILDSK